MFEQANAERRDPITDWVLRGGICLLFLLFGVDKFQRGQQWIDFFAQIGLGQWFRYFTGGVEVIGALLLLIPRTVTAGLILLASAMAGAGAVHIFVMHHPWNALIPFLFFAGLILFWLRRRAAVSTTPHLASAGHE